MKNWIFFCLLVSLIVFPCSCQEGEFFDVVVYGGTPGGVISAVAASRNGAKVLLIEQTNHVGGLSTSGINTAESEHMINKAITGIALEFYVRMGEQFPDGYFETFHDGRMLNFEKGDPAFFFESHIAEELYNEMLKEAEVTVLYGKYVDSVSKKNKTIDQIVLTDGTTVNGKMFIDASYEGDLMARSDVSYTYGREDKNTYNESYAGIRFMDDTLSARTIDRHGKILPYFSKDSGLKPGAGDDRVMNYNFRLSATKIDSNKVEIPKPDDYDPSQFDLLRDYLKNYPETKLNRLMGIYERGSGKFEFNNKQDALISLGLFGGNREYPDADYATRKKIFDDHKSYTLGFLYFLGHDESVPKKLQQEMRSYGFCKDEFVDNDHFPYYLYIREARRMVGDFVFTQKDILDERSKEDAVMLGSHWIDSHHVQRVQVSDSTFTNEGRIWHKVTEPYEIPYRILLPKTDEVSNLLVPVCSSLSHVAFCSYRLESTWMQMGHVAGTAAALTVKNKTTPAELKLNTLREQLAKEGVIYKIEELGEYDDYDNE